MSALENGKEIAEKIKKSNLSLYEKLEETSDLYIPLAELEALLKDGLIGLSLKNLPIRTRSKVLKTKICEIIGYPVPNVFKKTQPRFLSQNFDTYAQKSLNLQIWNEEVDPHRRYALIRINEDDVVTAVRVISGDQLSELDHTGKLTKKFQARLPDLNFSALLSEKDTDNVIEWCESTIDNVDSSPTDNPSEDEMFPIEYIYRKLLPLVGTNLGHLGATQERNRGAELQKIVCRILGYSHYSDDGQYPDVKNQLLEIKLQTSPTIDLGLHSPNSDEIIIHVGTKTFKDKDVRYAIFAGEIDGNTITITRLFVVTGEEFIDQIPLFGGLVQNSKIQIPLPRDFFDQ